MNAKEKRQLARLEHKADALEEDLRKHFRIYSDTLGEVVAMRLAMADVRALLDEALELLDLAPRDGHAR